MLRYRVFVFVSFLFLSIVINFDKKCANSTQRSQSPNSQRLTIVFWKIKNLLSKTMACDSRQNSTLNSVLHTFHFVTQIVFCIQIVKIKFYFVFQILFCFELCSLNSVLSPKFYFVCQILFCFELCSLNSVLSPKFYFVFQILFCFELCSLNSVLSPKFYFTLKWQFA